MTEFEHLHQGAQRHERRRDHQGRHQARRLGKAMPRTGVRASVVHRAAAASKGQPMPSRAARAASASSTAASTRTPSSSPARRERAAPSPGTRTLGDAGSGRDGAAGVGGEAGAAGKGGATAEGVGVDHLDEHGERHRRGRILAAEVGEALGENVNQQRQAEALVALVGAAER